VIDTGAPGCMLSFTRSRRRAAWTERRLSGRDRTQTSPTLPVATASRRSEPVCPGEVATKVHRKVTPSRKGSGSACHGCARAQRSSSRVRVAETPNESRFRPCDGNWICLAERVSNRTRPIAKRSSNGFSLAAWIVPRAEGLVARPRRGVGGTLIVATVGVGSGNRRRSEPGRRQALAEGRSEVDEGYRAAPG